MDFSKLKGKSTLPKERRLLLAGFRYALDQYGCRPCLDIEVEQFLAYKLADVPTARVPWEDVRGWARELVRSKDRGVHRPNIRRRPISPEDDDTSFPAGVVIPFLHR